MSRQMSKTGKTDLANWKFIAAATGRDADDLATVAATVIHPRHHEIGLHYQQFVYGLLMSLPPGDITVVETGVRTGISTYFILSALAHRGSDQGHLFSCDPMYRNQGLAENRLKEYEYFPYWKGKDAYFKNWSFIAEKSAGALPKIVAHAAEWDVFVHDSDHSAANIKFELNFAWEHLKPGGFIVVDDPDGDDTVGRHTAFDEWANAKNLQWGFIGQAAIVQKPGALVANGKLIVGDATKVAMVADETSRVPHPSITLESAPSKAAGEPVNGASEQTIEEMEAAVNAAVAASPPVAPAEEEKPEDDTNLDDLSDLSKPGKAKGAAVNFSDDDLDELDDHDSKE